MGHNQYSLLRNVIQGQDAAPSGEDPAANPAGPLLPGPDPAAPARPTGAHLSVRPPLRGPSPRLTTPPHSGHMKLLFDNAPVALAMFDTEMRYLLANRRWLEDFKLSKMDVTGRSQYELFPSLHPGWRHVYNRALGGQVVRSDRDAITQDGNPVIYRWEVRPWRHMDTTIGGVTISCERLYATSSGAESPGAAAPDAEDDAISLWKTGLPLLAVTGQGRILRVSEGLRGTVPDLSDEDDPVFFWDVFGDEGQQTALRRQTLVALSSILAGGQSQASVFTFADPEESGDTPQPSQWLISRLNSGLAGNEGEAALMIGVTAAAPPSLDDEESESPISMPATASVEMRQLAAEVARLRQAQKEVADAESVSRQREARLRAVLELAPCGLMVINEHACPIYQNAQVTALLGRPTVEGQPMHEWLATGARDARHRAELVRLWSEEVWRKRHTVPVPLNGTDGLHREVEMRPVALPGGGLLLMLQDVTESRRSEEMLRSTEAKFRTLVHENPLPVVLADRSGAVFDVNPACEQLLGHTRAEMRRMPLEKWLDADSLKRRASILQEMTRRGERFAELQVQVVHADEYAFPVHLRLAVVPDVSGQPMFTLHFFSPVEGAVVPVAPGTGSRPAVSEKSEAESPPVSGEEPVSPPASTPLSEESVPLETLDVAISEEHRTPESSADSPPSVEAEPALPLEPVTLLTTDVHGRIASWAEPAAARFGYTEDEILGRSLHALFRPSDATAFASDLIALGDASQHEVQWKFFHKTSGRHEAAFLIHPSGEGPLALTLLEHPPVSSPSDPSAEDGLPANAPASPLEEELPPPPFMDEEDAPEERPIIPAALLEDPLDGSTTEEGDAPAITPPEPSSDEVLAAPDASPVASSSVRPSVQELQRERLLLGETHHRVKNHLQIITSMLNLQMSTLHNEEARDALRSSQNRVRSIAALHQHLYLLTSGETADFQAFATGLINHLRECYHVTPERVPLEITLPDQPLPEEWLMPLALALNEMVSNAFKHAFPEDRAGEMIVSLLWDDTHGHLIVSDDGTGLPEDFSQHDHPGMGLKILRVFAGQLGGEVKTSPGTPEGKGVAFELIFPVPKSLQSAPQPEVTGSEG